ncbi:hypothetical protein NFI96_016112, partial [Prochilodus magdalenae]
MRLMKFTYTVSHVPGKNIATADVLSRVPENGQGEKQPEEEINLYKNTVLSSLPATEKRLLEIQKHQENDAVLREVRKYCLEGWPNKFLIDGTVQQYYPFSGFVEPVVLNGKRILQEMCRNGTGWDDPLTDELQPRWERWKGDLINLEKIDISRSYVPASSGKIVRAELHHFSDAGSNGY